MSTRTLSKICFHNTDRVQIRIWELAVAVQVSSGMENREDLGRQLAQFGNKIRDVKDAMYVLHSKGITTFQWALHRVSSVLHLDNYDEPLLRQICCSFSLRDLKRR